MSLSFWPFRRRTPGRPPPSRDPDQTRRLIAEAKAVIRERREEPIVDAIRGRRRPAEGDGR